MLKNNLKYKQNFKYDIVVKDSYFYAFFYHSTSDSFDLLNKKEE